MIDLLCKWCNSFQMHHEEVNVYERAQDATEGLHVRVYGVDAPSPEGRYRKPEVTTDSDLSRNPSSRRQGVDVLFWCERCGRHSLLTIAQHKGLTMVELLPYES